MPITWLWVVAGNKWTAGYGVYYMRQGTSVSYSAESIPRRAGRCCRVTYGLISTYIETKHLHPHYPRTTSNMYKQGIGFLTLSMEKSECFYDLSFPGWDGFVISFRGEHLTEDGWWGGGGYSV